MGNPHLVLCGQAHQLPVSLVVSIPLSSCAHLQRHHEKLLSQGSRDGLKSGSSLLKKWLSAPASEVDYQIWLHKGMCNLRSCYYVLCRDIWIPSFMTNCTAMNFPVPFCSGQHTNPVTGHSTRHANLTARVQELNELPCSTPCKPIEFCIFRTFQHLVLADVPMSLNGQHSVQNLCSNSLSSSWESKTSFPPLSW